MTAAIVDLVGRIEGAELLCVGDIMLDCFVYGEAERLSPEAPVPILKVQHQLEMIGAAGNVARNLAVLGARVHLVAVVGDDDIARELTTLCAAIPGVSKGFVADATRPTSRKTRYIAGGQQLLRADEEVTTPVSDAVAHGLIKEIRRGVNACGAVILSDYGKGTLTDDVLSAVMTAAREAGKPVLVDPIGLDYGRYRGAALVTPNRKELAEASRMPTNTAGEVEAAARHIIDACGVDSVLGTRGAQGMALVGADGVAHIPAEAREVFDVTGAGDTVIALTAAGIAAGAPMREAVTLANVAAGLVVGKAGTAVVERAELIAALQRKELHAAEAKLAGTRLLAERVSTWRAKGLRIGFTNGCFDLLHPGHVSLLAQARASCDRLIVGLNSDASVRRLKGDGRPVQGAAARAAVLGSLATVDLVTLFEEDTPIELIRAIRPDVLVKGADYAAGEVVGADVVASYGGEVVLADIVEGYSTSGTLEKLAR